jgi:acetylornithine deacetylase
MSSSTATNVTEGALRSVVDTASTLIAMHPVYGSTGQGRALAYLEQRMHALGARTRRARIFDEEIEAHPCYCHVENFGGQFSNYRETLRENLLSEIDFGGDGPTILCNGHLDVEFVLAPTQWTVAESWRRPRLDGGKLYGRGSSDMLGAIACFLATAEYLIHEASKLSGRLLLHFVVDEEIGGNGTLATLTTLGEKVDAAIIGEPTDGAVCTRSRSFEQFKIVCHGRPRHMCFGANDENALAQASETYQLIEALDGWCREQVPSDHAFRSLCVGVVSGGSDAAVPAPTAELLVTAALPPELSLSRVLARLAAQLEHRFGRDRCPQVEPYGIRFPGSTMGHEPLAAALRAGIERRGGHSGSANFPSACDARIFEAFGIPAVICGPGSLQRAHGPDEYIGVDELASYTDLLNDTLGRAFRGELELRRP